MSKNWIFSLLNNSTNNKVQDLISLSKRYLHKKTVAGCRRHTYSDQKYIWHSIVILKTQMSKESSDFCDRLPFSRCPFLNFSIYSALIIQQVASIRILKRIHPWSMFLLSNSQKSIPLFIYLLQFTEWSSIRSSVEVICCILAKFSAMNVYSLSALLTLTAISLFGWSRVDTCYAFSIKEASISDLQLAFSQNLLTSTQLVEFYLREISRLNPVLKGVTEVIMLNYVIISYKIIFLFN